jgi:hypothetical protein
MDNLEIAKAATAIPLTALLLLVLIGGYMGWWIYGSLHRAQILEKDKQIIDETARADKWEGRFLELNAKLDSLRRVTNAIGNAVDGTATVAADKLANVEQTLETVRAELTEIKSRGQQRRQGE